MWRPDRSVRGPDRPGLRDIEPLNRVFASGSFSDGINPASVETWTVTIAAIPTQFTLTLHPESGSGTTDDTTITFTT